MHVRTYRICTVEIHGDICGMREERQGKKKINVGSPEEMPLYRTDYPFWKPFTQETVPLIACFVTFHPCLFHFASSKIMLSTMRMQLLRKRDPILHQSQKLSSSGDPKDMKCSFMLSPVTTSRRLNLQWEYLTVSILHVSFWTAKFSFSSWSSSDETRSFKFEGWQRVQWWHLSGHGIEKTPWKSMVLPQSHHKYEFSETTWQRNRFWYHWCHPNSKTQPSRWVLFDQ